MNPTHSAAPPIYVVSGGSGASGEQIVYTVLAQFPDHDVPVVTFGRLRHGAQIEAVVTQAQAQGATIVHTLVDAGLRAQLEALARRDGISALDLMGPLLNRLATVLGHEPLGQPGLYRQLRRAYFERVAAIEYTLAHDDGQSPQDWPLADVVLAGVSRTGKTPLSVLLSVQGWKTANLPIVLDLPTPPELFQLPASRVIGLTLEPERLLALRRDRVKRIRALAGSAYVDLDRIVEESRLALSVFRQGGFYVLDVTDKTLEASADEIFQHVARTG
jgi:regulator of PEP synthase PpsR (kinase-PPPase family)